MADNTPSWARKGAEAASKQARKDKEKQGSGGFTPEFYLTAKEPKALIRIMDFDDVLVVRTHSVKYKGYFKNITCPGLKVCPLCAADEFRGTRYVVNVIDRRSRKVKGKVYKNQMKVWMMFTALYEQLKVLDEKYDVYERDIEITRTGSGKKINHSMLPEEPSDLTTEEENMKVIDLVDFLKPKSKEILEKLVPNNTDFDDDDGSQDAGW